MNEVFVAMLLTMGSVGACLARLGAVHRALSYDLEQLGRALGREADRSDLKKLIQAMSAEGPSWELEVATAAFEASSEAERVALVNELVADIALTLDGGTRVPYVAVRVCLAGAFALLFLLVARQSPRPSGAPLHAVVALIAWGVLGAATAGAAGRSVGRVVERSKKGIDLWVERVLHAAGRIAERGPADAREGESPTLDAPHKKNATPPES